MIKNMSFRPYSTSDKDACLSLFDENSPEFFAPNERADYASFLDDCPDGYELWMVDGSIVGAYGLIGDGLDHRSLNWILLGPETQGMGIGTAIMSRVANLARQSNGSSWKRVGDFRTLSALRRLQGKALQASVAP